MKLSLIVVRTALLIASAIVFLSLRSAVGQANGASTASDSKSSLTQPVQSGHPASAGNAKTARRHSAKAPVADGAPSVPGVTAFEPEKTIIRNGGARDLRLQLTPTMTADQAAKQRRQTKDLLTISNENLKRIAQTRLDDNQQDMLQEVHNYMEQARLADKAGELQRAQTLASKARQLSDDLAGVRTFLKLWPW